MKPYLSKSEVAEAIGVSPSTVDQLVKQGKLPPPARITPSLLRWRWEMVDQALASLIPGSNASLGDQDAEGVRRAIESATRNWRD
jgi:predicted DNA-binding transcriptional regulator AlpA